MPSKKRVVQISVLPGEPTDGSGKVCIPLIVQDETSLFNTPPGLHQGPDNRMEAKQTRRRLA